MLFQDCWKNKSCLRIIKQGFDSAEELSLASEEQIEHFPQSSECIFRPVYKKNINSKLSEKFVYSVDTFVFKRPFKYKFIHRKENGIFEADINYDSCVGHFSSQPVRENFVWLNIVHPSLSLPQVFKT